MVDQLEAIFLRVSRLESLELGKQSVADALSSSWAFSCTIQSLASVTVSFFVPTDFTSTCQPVNV
jgi:hypothetical protein